MVAGGWLVYLFASGWLQEVAGFLLKITGFKYE